MARTKKPATLEEKLVLLNDSIEKKEEELKNLKREKKETEKAIKDKELQDLQNLLSEKGITVEDVRKLIKA